MSKCFRHHCNDTKITAASAAAISRITMAVSVIKVYVDSHGS